jgi:hypothetical protein
MGPASDEYITDGAALREAFGVGADAVDRIVAEQEPEASRPPWWKRLLGR